MLRSHRCWINWLCASCCCCSWSGFVVSAMSLRNDDSAEKYRQLQEVFELATVKLAQTTDSDRRKALQSTLSGYKVQLLVFEEALAAPSQTSSSGSIVGIWGKEGQTRSVASSSSSSAASLDMSGSFQGTHSLHGKHSVCRGGDLWLTVSNCLTCLQSHRHARSCAAGR